MRHQPRSWPAVAMLLAALAMVAIPAQATVLGTYSDRTTWEGVTSGRTDIDFESLGIGVGGYTSYSTSAGLAIGGVQFVGVLDPSTYFLYALNPPSGASEDYGSSTVLKGPELRPTSYLLVNLGPGVTSFGVDLMTIFPAGSMISIFLDGVQVGMVSTQSKPTRTFFGVQTDTAFSQIKFVLSSGTTYSTQILLDNFAYGAAMSGGPTPPAETVEVTTLLYVGTGIGLLGWTRRRRDLMAS